MKTSQREEEPTTKTIKFLKFLIPPISKLRIKSILAVAFKHHQKKVI